ncbi:hypothetical protein [Mesorhizobium sp. M0968]|uniref:hypothetical protein n=1 Tax=Mesorhizobium sp. M0968 TaxID=2957037 RepID=UPI00333BDB48
MTLTTGSSTCAIPLSSAAQAPWSRLDADILLLDKRIVHSIGRSRLAYSDRLLLSTPSVCPVL